ncbi:dehydrogenase [ubiquinone] 1 subunit C2 [Octopus vulgaris]|uniref:Dehydrogenase [ubiquinone] 1 subunit C2 n=1 Tax=Octopus vulgaris TaxID=6645 RepID=A0AA36BD09_OCTVU|nr:dehydrogenase [ubiquinone] 1 subunit C2 [Octopus vulgaris]
MKGILDLSAEEAGMSVVGILTAVSHNMFKNRPVYAGIQRHIAFGLIGLYLGNLIKNYRLDYNRRKWIYIEDYMAKHPERFPEAPKLLYKDVLLQWRPVR